MLRAPGRGETCGHELGESASFDEGFLLADGLEQRDRTASAESTLADTCRQDAGEFNAMVVANELRWVQATATIPRSPFRCNAVVQWIVRRA